MWSFSCVKSTLQIVLPPHLRIGLLGQRTECESRRLTRRLANAMHLLSTSNAHMIRRISLFKFVSTSFGARSWRRKQEVGKFCYLAKICKSKHKKVERKILISLNPTFCVVFYRFSVEIRCNAAASLTPAVRLIDSGHRLVSKARLGVV